MILPCGCCDMTFPSLPTRHVLLHPEGQCQGPGIVYVRQVPERVTVVITLQLRLTTIICS